MRGAVAAAKVADPFGHPIHLALAMAYSFVLPLDMVHRPRTCPVD